MGVGVKIEAKLGKGNRRQNLMDWSELLEGYGTSELSSKFVHKLLRHFAHRHTDGRAHPDENITSSAEVIRSW